MPSDGEHFYFGHPAAAQDTYLDKYFILTEAFKTISDLADPRCVVVGKKGCGKTALFTKLAESKASSRLITTINPDTHQLGKVTEYSYRQYANLFQYEILLEVLKSFCENDEIKKRFDKAFDLKARTAAG
jgi:ABC-type lipoprotein export system ATPase subunit